MSNYPLPSRLLPPRLLGTRGAAGQSTGPTAVHVDLGDPGKCPERPTLSIMDFDDSGSVLGGADSTGLRYQEAELALDRVGRRCKCGHDLVAIMHFDSPSSGDRPPTPIKKDCRGDLLGGLAVPLDGTGASEMRSSLGRAVSMAQAYPDHDATFICFTDFELFDRDLSGLWDQLGQFPGVVHAVCLRAQPPQALLDNPNIVVTTVPHGATPGPVARALFAATTSTRPGRRPRFPAGGAR